MSAPPIFPPRKWAQIPKQRGPNRCTPPQTKDPFLKGPGPTRELSLTQNNFWVFNGNRTPGAPWFVGLFKGPTTGFPKYQNFGRQGPTTRREGGNPGWGPTQPQMPKCVKNVKCPNPKGQILKPKFPGITGVPGIHGRAPNQGGPTNNPLMPQPWYLKGSPRN